MYTVQFLSPSNGVHGDAGASVISGGLSVKSEYDSDGDGIASVEAESAAEAVAKVETGSVTINTSVIKGLTDTTYTFGPATIGTAKAGQPFLWSKDRIWLEDLAAYPKLSDKDYNDDFWRVKVNLAPADPRTAPVVVDPKTMTRIKTGTVVPARVDPANSTQIEIGISGGHMEGSVPKTLEVDVGVGTARRKATVTLTPVAVDPKIDATTKAHEVRIEGTVKDPGPPPGANAADIKKSPIVTKVIPVDGKPKNVTKTEFPTKWDEAKVKDAITKAAEKGQKSGMAPEWKPDAKLPTEGTGLVTIDSVKIDYDWKLKDGKLVITHANPVK